ncbi:glucosamine-6-phosphate deaminase [Pseudochrobactrum saccharolyticum]|uniref:glucosamine-6-phosphate deaminase n=1 Tax=Pseudochrobactrum saccharolyticum TaxID=354352 RepID=UPI002760A620|nr:glucosamine-6-phosphate deaminase [Pseudochrobactrum saccharolyticum]MDP8251777.1 glucosamine-6-phosphate deaminase [Pseudochrobactrum saccharolyticum]
MEIRVFDTKQQLGEAAAKRGAEAIRSALRNKGKASIIVATGASQFEMLEVLIREPDIDWSKVTAFHLDEYVGMKKSHPASFRRYLIERFVEPLGSKVTLHEINAEDNPGAEAGRLSKLIVDETIDVCFAGIGENCHLAFNDPPADFETDKPYIIVDLDEACRRQQMGEGWFATLEDVPAQAISMSIKQIMKSSLIILSVPDQRKAQAVKNALAGPVTPLHPASILQNHNNTVALLDTQSASLLSCSPKA